MRQRFFSGPRWILPAIAVIVASLASLAPAPAAHAAQTRKKALFDAPLEIGGVSQFPRYQRMGVGIFQLQLRWDEVAPTPPLNPADPADPAYRWPGQVDYAIAEAAKHRMAIGLQVQYSPGWANGGRSREWAPQREQDYASFVAAAARRYPSVRLWMIWGEPCRPTQFKPMPAYEATGPRRYARILDAAYGALKGVSRRNVVIGGNTYTTCVTREGGVPPLKFIQSLRLPSGRRPRMDMYGHNPFSRREPDLRKRPLTDRRGRTLGFADFSDLDTLAGWLDRYLSRRRRLPLYLSEFTVPTDHKSREFNFWVTRRTQARFLASALRITRRWSRIYTLGWVHLYDEPPNGRGTEVNGGLLDWRGRPKPAYYAYVRG